MCSPRCAASASTTPSSRSTGPKCRSWTAAPRRSSPRSIRPASSTLAARAPLHQGAQAGPRRAGRSFGELRPYARGFRLDVEIEFKQSDDRQPDARRSISTEDVPQRDLPAPAPSASCATWRSSGTPVMRSALRSRTRWWSAKTACSIRRACARRRVRPPQGARCARRSVAGRSAAARRLPVGARRPQAQPCGAVGADGRPHRLAGG